MNCNQAKQQLDTLTWIDESDADSELVQHLNTCDDCRNYARERKLVSLLGSLPVRQPEAGFEDRVIRNALAPTGRRRIHGQWALATAASVILAVFLTMQFMPGTEVNGPGKSVESVETTVIEVSPRETRQVNLRLNSPRAMSNALIRVQLDDHLELDGYSGVQNLEWRTTLKSGANQLSLPVRLLENQSGTVTIMLEHEGASKRFSITINPIPRDDERGQTVTTVTMA